MTEAEQNAEDARELARSLEQMLDSPRPSDGAEEGPPPLVRIVEALLFVGGPPLTAVRAAEAVRGLTAEQLQQCVDALNRDYRQQGRPYRIQPREQGYELVLHGPFRAVAERLYGTQKEARLSPAALDVLALVAYRQPIGRQDVDSLRGGDSGNALRLLVRLGLVVLERDPASPREVKYRTTRRFLDLFQLRSLEDLPRTQELQQM